MIGDASISHPTATLTADSDSIKVGWKAWNEDEKVKICLATINNFREGGEDRYSLVKEVPLTSREASIDVSGMPSIFYKVVLEARGNTVNRWIVSISHKMNAIEISFAVIPQTSSASRHQFVIFLQE